MGNEMGNNHIIGIEGSAPVSDNPDAEKQINKSSDASVVSKDVEAMKAIEQDDAEGVGTSESPNQKKLSNDAEVPERMNQTSLSIEHDDRNEKNKGFPQDGSSAADDNRIPEKLSEEKDTIEISSEEMMKENEDLRAEEIIAIRKTSANATELLEHNETEKEDLKAKDMAIRKTSDDATKLPEHKETNSEISPLIPTLLDPVLSVNEEIKKREKINATGTGTAAGESSKQLDEELGGQIKEVPDTAMRQISPDCSKEKEEEKQITDELVDESAMHQMSPDCSKEKEEEKQITDELVDESASNICSTVEISDSLNSSSELPAINEGSLALSSEVNIQNNLQDVMSPLCGSQITAHKTEVSEFENNELGLNSVKRLYEFSAMDEESNQIPSFDQKNTVKGDTFCSEKVVSETDEDVRIYHINTSQEAIDTEKSPLLCQERPSTSEFPSLERSDSAKFRTPLLYAVVSLDEKEGLLVEKSVIDACLTSANEQVAASPRERGKKNPIYSFFCNCICCGTTMD